MFFRGSLTACDMCLCIILLLLLHTTVPPDLNTSRRRAPVYEYCHPVLPDLRGRDQPVVRRLVPLHNYPVQPAPARPRSTCGLGPRREARTHSRHAARHYCRGARDTAREGDVPSPEDEPGRELFDMFRDCALRDANVHLSLLRLFCSKAP
jgi:hypothetical protein